jgi:phage shock protein A
MLPFNNYLDQIQADYNYVIGILHTLKKSQKKERQKIQETIQKLKHLKACLQAAKHSQQPSLSLGLPELSFATKQQKKSCILYLEHRLKTAQMMGIQIEKLTSFIQSLAQGDGFDFLLKLRLPGVRTILRKIFSLKSMTKKISERNNWINHELHTATRMQYKNITELRTQVEKLSHRKLKIEQCIENEKRAIDELKNQDAFIPKMANDTWIIEQFQRQITQADPFFPLEQRLASLKNFIQSEQGESHL